MAGTLAPTEKCLENHTAVRLNNSILVLSKTFERDHTIILWTYNLWTEQWAKNATPESKGLPCIKNPTGVVIGTDVYIFWEHKTSKLTRKKNGSFVSCVIDIGDQTKAPSLRLFPCGWEHGEKMCVFGGFGQSPVDYLNDHGDFTPWAASYGANNQLSFDPSTQTWPNAECFGDIPAPRCEASTARVEDAVWLYGGSTDNNLYNNDLHELNMLSFVWTKIETTMPRPHGNHGASLTPISASQLVLYGGVHQDMDDQNRMILWYSMFSRIHGDSIAQ